MLLSRLLNRLIQYGDLTVIDAHGRRHRFGGRPIEDLPAALAPPPVTIRLHDPALHWRMVTSTHLATGEAFMNGTLTVEDGGTLYDFLALAVYNMARSPGQWAVDAQHRLNRALRWLHQHNPMPRAQANVAHHYDLSGALYDLFLDADRQYSCAYFPTGGETLEEAQEAKKRHIAGKLLLRPGHRVLDIGSGWGGMALYLAGEHDCTVEGVTLSREQLALARDRARAAGLSGRVEFFLRDYRYHSGRYDRIVSVGMFEHVGVNHYDEFFGKVHELLADDGVALLHTIGRASPPGGTNAWLRKYIFPGGYTPALSEVMAAVERSGLKVTDVEVLRHHYADTLRAWRQRFMANRDRAVALYDERFARMWEFYLAGCEAVFRFDDQVVFQVQLARRNDVVPTTRDYITAFDRRRHLKVIPPQDTGKAAAE
ncbi:class I SAM-dependent methyltransferase [Novispirillum sp. DQ9]|uniref:class I SAM-dependent methyltransferase n=1 Tax=Novispirillum sp. DQ9 TaxID=3398612 RepID=UPI003C7B4FE5